MAKNLPATCAADEIIDVLNLPEAAELVVVDRFPDQHLRLAQRSSLTDNGWLTLWSRTTDQMVRTALVQRARTDRTVAAVIEAGEPTAIRHALCTIGRLGPHTLAALNAAPVTTGTQRLLCSRPELHGAPDASAFLTDPIAALRVAVNDDTVDDDTVATMVPAAVNHYDVRRGNSTNALLAFCELAWWRPALASELFRDPDDMTAAYALRGAATVPRPELAQTVSARVRELLTTTGDAARTHLEIALEQLRTAPWTPADIAAALTPATNGRNPRTDVWDPAGPWPVWLLRQAVDTTVSNDVHWDRYLLATAAANTTLVPEAVRIARSRVYATDVGGRAALAGQLAASAGAPYPDLRNDDGDNWLDLLSDEDIEDGYNAIIRRRAPFLGPDADVAAVALDQALGGDPHAWEMALLLLGPNSSAPFSGTIGELAETISATLL